MASDLIRKPSASMIPSAAASRSSSVMAAAIHSVSVSLVSGARADTRPPAPRLATRAPSSPREKDSGPRLETTTSGLDPTAMPETLTNLGEEPVNDLGDAVGEGRGGAAG